MKKKLTHTDITLTDHQNGNNYTKSGNKNHDKKATIRQLLTRTKQSQQTSITKKFMFLLLVTKW